MKYDDAIKLQKEIAKKVVTEDDFGQINLICGVDVAYSGDIAYCSAVVTDSDLHLVESVDLQTETAHPYVSGLLMLREAKPILETLTILRSDFDLLMVDGHGVMHPRKCGLACYLGVLLDKPTIGVAKGRLCGTVRSDGFVELDSEIVGYAMSMKRFVSVGNRVSLKSAVIIARRLGIELLRLADINSKAQRKKGVRL